MRLVRDSTRRWLDRRGFSEVIGLADVDKLAAEAYLAVEPHYGRLLAERLGW